MTLKDFLVNFLSFLLMTCDFPLELELRAKKIIHKLEMEACTDID